MTNVQNVILDHLRNRSRGKVYTSKNLVHFGNRAAVDQALSRLARDGKSSDWRVGSTIIPGPTHV